MPEGFLVVKKYFCTLTQTLEGDASLSNHSFSIKREPKTEAYETITDIVLHKHEIPKIYSRLG